MKIGITLLRLIALGALTLVQAAVHAQDYSGMYATKDQNLILLLESRPDGSVVGLLEDEDNAYDVTMGPAEDKLIGAAKGEDGTNYPVLAQLHKNVLYFKLYQADAQGNTISESGVQFEFYPQGDLGQAGAFPGNPLPQQQQQPMRTSTYPQSGGVGQPPQQTGGSNAAVQQLTQYLAGRHVLVSWRDGGAVYGTYTFLNTHYCPNGQYRIYANSHKQSVLGGENRQNWEVFGRWQVMHQGGQLGVYYQDNQGGTEFVPVQITANGLYIREGVTFAPQGQAQCY
ncbi:MAG: hypothetical protein ACR2PZ_02595 [Pseudomonadales bacterium]